MNAKPRILVLGGGFGGLESLFYLKHVLGDRGDLTLVTDRPYFVFKPNTIYIPFGEPAEKYELDLVKPLQKQSIKLVEGTVAKYRPREPSRLNWRPASSNSTTWSLPPGRKCARRKSRDSRSMPVTVWTSDDMLVLRDRIADVIDRAKDGESVEGPVPRPAKQPLLGSVVRDGLHARHVPATSRLPREFVEPDLRDQGGGLHRSLWSATEYRGLPRSSPTASIAGPCQARGDRGRAEIVRFQNGAEFAYDLLISFPPYAAARNFSALPVDDRGFVNVDPSSRRVVGFGPHLYAVGDAGNFPIKQAFLGPVARRRRGRPPGRRHPRPQAGGRLRAR